MIVFWTVNDQRKKRFLAVDIVHCSRGFRVFSDDQFVFLHNNRRTKVKPAAIFDDSTTPWTLKEQASHQSMAYLATKHPKFPATFIVRPSGNIVNIRFQLVMEAPKE